MTTFNTRNALGSKDPKDLYDNAQNLDDGINGTAKTWTDRLGVERKSWNGIETDFQQFLADGSTIEFPTWAAASAAAGAGQIPLNRQVAVIGDAGTHVDPVSGQTVSNSGRYVMTAAGLEWRSADVLSEKADRQAVAEMIKNDEVYDPVRVAVIFEGDRSRSWLEVGPTGRPTLYAAGLIDEMAGPLTSDRVQADIGYAQSEGYTNLGLVLRFADGSVALALDRSGNPITKVPRFSQMPAAAYGDSTTAGADLATPVQDRWTALLEKRMGKRIRNYGVSGERSEEIQFRAASIRAPATVVGGVLAGSGNTTLVMDSVDPLRASTSAHQVIAICEDGQQVLGRLSASGATRVFARSLAGPAVSTGKVQLICVAGRQNRGQLLFLGMGVNDEDAVVSGSKTVSEIKALYRSAVENLSADNPTYVIWGLLDRGPAEAAGTPIGDYIREMERWLGEQFGSSFCPVRRFLASAYAFSVAATLSAGFTPSADDTAAMQAQTVPPSFRVAANSVHLNVLGHQLQAWYMHQHLIARGII